MTRARALLLTIISSTFLFPSCTSVVGAPTRETSNYARAETSTERRISDQLFKLTNAHRAKLGRKALSPDTYIKKLAMEHATYLATKDSSSNNIKDFAHAGVQQRADVVRAKRTQLLGENVVWSNSQVSTLSETMFKSLLSSKPHRKAIEQKNWKWMGISVAKGNYKNAYYAVQLFSRPYIKPAPMAQFVFQ